MHLPFVTILRSHTLAVTTSLSLSSFHIGTLSKMSVKSTRSNASIRKSTYHWIKKVGDRFDEHDKMIQKFERNYDDRNIVDNSLEPISLLCIDGGGLRGRYYSFIHLSLFLAVYGAYKSTHILYYLIRMLPLPHTHVMICNYDICM